MYKRQPPYQASVARYTDNYIMQISGSKAFSYAGQRIGVTAISNKLYHRSYPGLTQRYGGGTFGTVYILSLIHIFQPAIGTTEEWIITTPPPSAT